MDAWRFILASLRHYRRIQLAVALGVAVATAVLTGALLVGDSVRGSLRDLTLQRLGRIDTVLVTGHMFREALAGELAANAEFKNHFAAAEPAVLLNGTLESGDGKRRATQVNVVGSRPEFWALGDGDVPPPLADREVFITEPLASELNAKVGEEIVLRIPLATSTPGDSVLGHKGGEESSESIRLKVATVLPAEGLARFGIAPTQQLPRNGFVPLATLQGLLKQSGKANAILLATNETDRASGDEAARALKMALQPKLEDYGVKIEGLTQPHDAVQLSADALVLPEEIVRAVGKAFPGRGGNVQPIVTYLANTIVAGEGKAERKIPYSTIVGVDSTAQLGPLVDEKGQAIKLASDEIVLNRWAADDLGMKVGDPIKVTYYEPESTHGKLRERASPPLKLRAIVELQTEDGRPTLAADPKLTPELPGVTDQKSISNWDLPFELVEKIRPQDEDYWEEYRTTPKAFVSLATAKELWGSRWGTISLLRFPFGRGTSDKAATVIQRAIDPSSLGMTWLPVKAQGLAASAGTTPFEALFLGFSFFLIAAAVMLVALLFQLGIEERARELGTLAAVGIGRHRITRLLAREGLVVAAVGATIGVVAGIFYAWLMVFGLRTWWLAAISTPFLKLHVTWPSVIIGWLTGVIISWLTIRWSIRRLVRLPAARLLAGSTTSGITNARQLSKKRGWLPSWSAVRVALATLVVAQCLIGFFLHGEAQAGIFFGSGAAMLALLLGEIRYRLRDLAQQLNFRQSFSLFKLAALNTARNPGRSTLTIGLVAAASFLIAAVSAFRLDTGEAGTGGFDLVATSDLPIHYDLNTPEGRRNLNVSDRPRKGERISDEQLLSRCRFFSFRVADGEDASCLNLYQPKQPRVLGVPDAFIERGGFGWAAAAKSLTSDQFINLWELLREKGHVAADGQEAIPVVLDAATAIYSLHLGGVGSQLTIRDAADRPVTLEVVGLLENSVLQGNLLVSEANFLKLFPDTAGYKFFLIEDSTRHAPRAVAVDGSVPEGSESVDGMRSVPATLESALAEEGFDAVEARDQLAQFLAVQNTYLSTFQSLGALGLLLGTIGLAVVQLRSVLERRGELALMRAEGFNRRRLSSMVICENAVLLLGGLAVGCLAAAIALIPQWIPHAASVPWSALCVLLGTIAAVGLLAGWLATRSALRAPLVAALRGD
jgi:ABC-type lipoprotein release transport system permease subunit